MPHLAALGPSAGLEPWPQAQALLGQAQPRARLVALGLSCEPFEGGRRPLVVGVGGWAPKVQGLRAWSSSPRPSLRLGVQVPSELPTLVLKESMESPGGSHRPIPKPP